MPILDWMTRGEDVRAAAHVPYQLLEAVPELDGGDSASGNMLTQGDNFDALKAFLPYFRSCPSGRKGTATAASAGRSTSRKGEGLLSCVTMCRRERTNWGAAVITCRH